MVRYEIDAKGLRSPLQSNLTLHGHRPAGHLGHRLQEFPVFPRESEEEVGERFGRLRLRRSGSFWHSRGRGCHALLPPEIVNACSRTKDHYYNKTNTNQQQTLTSVNK